MKSKSRGFRPTRHKDKSQIKFVDPEKIADVQTSVKQTGLNSNWESLKQKITSEPTQKPASNKTKKKKKKPKKLLSRSAAEPGRKRKAGSADGAPGKRPRMSSNPGHINNAQEKPPTIWFDDVDPSLLEYVPSAAAEPVTRGHAQKDKNATTTKLVKPSSFEGLTKALAIDCEMVGSDKQSLLARVSIVNSFGHCVYDTYVRPTEKVTDYRTWVSGVRAKDLKDAPSFEEVQKKVFALVDKRILVGHSLRNDLQVLYLSHPRKLIRDTSRYTEFRKLFGGRTPSLKNLSEKVLGVGIQTGEHSSVEDARAAMRLYTMHKPHWEKHISSVRHRKPKLKANT